MRETPDWYRRRTPEDSRIDPEKSIAEQFDLLRICEPRFPAFFEFRGHRYEIALRKKIDGVTVAFFLDEPTRVGICNKAMRAVRSVMPRAKIVHLTTPDGPKVDEADEVLAMPVAGTFSYRRTMLQSQLTGNVLILGADVVLREDVSHVFDRNFDIAIATDIAPGTANIKYNGDVVFSRCPAFWKELAEQTKDMDFGRAANDWAAIEEAYTRLIDSGRYDTLILPGEEYNYVPSRADESLEGRRAVHFRGLRKQWM